MFWPFKRYDVEMSPRVAGRVMDGDKPVVGIEVFRVLVYQGYKKGKELRASTVTDLKGRFEFSELMVRSRYPGDIFGQNFGVYQGVYLDDGPEVTYLWSTNKPPHHIATLAKLISNLDCEIKAKEKDYEIDVLAEGGRREQPITSICVWNNTYLKNISKHL